MATTPATAAIAAAAASNTFTVRDPETLQALLRPHGVTIVAVTGSRRVRLRFPGGLPYQTRDPDSGRTRTLDLPALIATQLEPGVVVVIKEIRTAGRELDGTAIAFDHTGATVTVDLEEITVHADQLKHHPLAA
jgi:hypothetical protein